MPEQERNPVNELREIQRRDGERFPYLVAEFKRDGSHALGVMDPTDPKSWRGESSDMILYFLITPEEFGWLQTDERRLDELADRIQEYLPKNRFFAGVSKQKLDRKELMRRCQALLREDALPEDQDFADWRDQHAPHLIQQERSPLAAARRELAEFQRNHPAKAASDAERMEEQRRERTLGYRLMESDHLYVAIDRCSPGGIWPGSEPVKGVAFLYTDEEAARTACEFYEKSQILYYEVQKLNRQDYLRYFQNCEMMGIRQFRLDDGIEPAVIDRCQIVPDRELSWLEERNQALRKTMLHSASLSTQVRQHLDATSGSTREALLAHTAGWRRKMLEAFSDALLYVPAALPQNLHETLKNDFVYSQRAMNRISQALAVQMRPESAKLPPAFRGKAVTIYANVRGRIDQNGAVPQQEGKLPLRVLTTEDQGRWILAFTEETLCRTFIEQRQHGDTMVVFTFEEIAEQTDEGIGILVDFMGLGIQLRRKDIDQILQIRKKETAEQKPRESARTEEKPVSPPEKEKPDETARPAVQQDPETEPPISRKAAQAEEGGQKKGWIERHFGSSRRKKSDSDQENHLDKKNFPR